MRGAQTLISRRSVLVGGLAFVAAGTAHASAWTGPPPGVLRFEVRRNGSRIGEHVVRIQQAGATLQTNVTVEMAVKFGPITLYRYAHTVREIWQDGRFLSFESETNDDGKRFRVRADSKEEGVVVETLDGRREVLPPGAVPLTHWNQQCMRSTPLIHPQDGDRVAPGVRALGEETIALADGRPIRATRFSLTGDVTLDDWYDATGSWTALQTKAKDGSAIGYYRVP